MKWLFSDLLSEGYPKEPWEFIIIEAETEDDARTKFTNFFHHNPLRITCPCCGEDYSIRPLADAEEYSNHASTLAILKGCGTND